MRCDQCRHWKRAEESNEEWEAMGAGLRECAAVRERWRIVEDAVSGLDMDVVGDDQYMTIKKEALRTAKAYVQDGSQYRAELFTGPDFFCALFAPMA